MVAVECVPTPVCRLHPGRAATREAMRIQADRLTPEELEPGAFHHALGVAQRWRASGLAVELVEVMPLAGEPGGYLLTAASATTKMVLRCQLWRQRRWLRPARSIWAMTVAVRHRDPDSVGREAAWLPAREIGVLAARDGEHLWEQVEAWIAGDLQPMASLEQALRQLP
jgi:hypothetical protein